VPVRKYNAWLEKDKEKLNKNKTPDLRSAFATYFLRRMIVAGWKTAGT
jgi:hypothetical protein